VVIARREIFDIRTQLMAEDSAGHDNEELIAGIEKGDIKPNFYEGGFKTWECALDLAKLSLDEDILNGFSDGLQDTHIIEVCCHVLFPQNFKVQTTDLSCL
jgi:protein-histidine N-methyltransferase